MEPTLYLAMTSAKRRFDEQRVYSNNLANVSTPGFRSDIYQAETVYLSNLNLPSSTFSNYLDSFNSPVQAFSINKENGIDFQAAPVMTTGRPLDIAIRDKGWIAVLGASGQEGYVRTASMDVDANGNLVTAGGLPVLDDGGGQISIPPFESVSVGDDGSITVIPQGGDPSIPIVVTRIKLADVISNNMELKKGSDGLIYTKNGEALPASAKVQITSGSIEQSNVNSVEQMVNMINANREYETSLKLMAEIDENQQALAQLLRIT